MTERQNRWNAVETLWLDAAFSTLAQHARRIGNGEAGVLVVTADLSTLTSDRGSK